MSLETPFEILGMGIGIAFVWVSGFVAGKWLKLKRKEGVIHGY